MKDSTVSARVETNIKDEAESILKQLGIPVSVVINALYRQIIYQNGIPFSLNLPSIHKSADELTEEELNDKLTRGYNQAIAGEGRPLEDVLHDLKKL